MKNFSDAIKAFKSQKLEEAKFILLALLKKPNVDSKIYYVLYQIFDQLKEYQSAKIYLIKFLEINPTRYLDIYNLAVLYSYTKEINKIEETYLKVIQLNKRYIPAIINLALYYERVGDFENAKKYYNKGINLAPNTLDFYYNLSRIDNNFIDEKKISHIKNILKKKNMRDNYYAAGFFLLANNANKKKLFNKEIEYLKKAHTHVFSGNLGSNKKSLNYWLNIIPKKYNRINYVISNQPNDNNKKLKPIFIIGLPRSGSTLVETLIMAGKNKIISTGESSSLNHSLINIYGNLLFNDNKDNDKNLNFEVNKIENKLFDKLNNLDVLKSKDQIFIDKSLENFFYIDLILNIFPSARFIHTHRNLNDNIMAIFQKMLTNISWTHSLENILNYVDNYLKVINDFKKKYPDKILSVNLKELTNQNEDWSKKIYNFCELEWSQDVLEFYKQKKTFVNTASNIQVRKKIYKYDIDKYKVYSEILKKFEKTYPWLI